MAMFVAIFNLSVNQEMSMKVIEEIAATFSENYQQWMDSKFLGVLLNIRQFIICDKYFLRQKKQLAVSFTIVLKLLNLPLLQRVIFYFNVYVWLI